MPEGVVGRLRQSLRDRLDATDWKVILIVVAVAAVVGAIVPLLLADL